MRAIKIDEARLARLETLKLLVSSHAPPRKGEDPQACVMEAVAWVAGEKWTDHPECVSPVIGAFLRRWNDDLDDEGRQRLKPYIVRVVGTNTGAKDDERRAWLLADWSVRVSTPAWLELAGMKDQAAALRALPEIASATSAKSAQPIIETARQKADAAWAAAWAAAWDAARDAAWDAARDAAGAAAGAAARDAAWDAAGDAARAAAGDAARAAAWAAARAAARKRLEPTKVSLQASAFELLNKLIAVGAPPPAASKEG